MDSLVDIQIFPATSEDNTLITQFMDKFFFPEEPLNSSIRRCPKPEEIDIMDSLKNGMSFKALNLRAANGENNLAGVVLNKEQTVDNKRDLSEIEDPKRLKIQKLLIKLDEKSRLWERVNNENHLNIISVSVNKQYRGLGVGRRLVEESLKLAKSLHYKYASIECSSYYSAKFITEMGFELLEEIPYEDYRDEGNEQVFKVDPPHEAIKKFIKKLQG